MMKEQIKFLMGVWNAFPMGKLLNKILDIITIPTICFHILTSTEHTVLKVFSVLILIIWGMGFLPAYNTDKTFKEEMDRFRREYT